MRCSSVTAATTATLEAERKTQRKPTADDYNFKVRSPPRYNIARHFTPAGESVLPNERTFKSERISACRENGGENVR